MSGCGHGENGVPIGVDCMFCGTDRQTPPITPEGPYDHTHFPVTPAAIKVLIDAAVSQERARWDKLKRIVEGGRDIRDGEAKEVLKKVLVEMAELESQEESQK